MRISLHLCAAALTAIVIATPTSQAQAGLSVAASLGQGWQLSEPKGREATSIMIAPGFDLLGLVRLELGVVGALAAVQDKDSEWGLQLRPMVVIAPPILPVYGRVVVASIRPFSDDRQLAYGGALGMSLSLAGVGLFAEAGVLPRSVDETMHWVLEGRAGVLISL